MASAQQELEQLVTEIQNTEGYSDRGLAATVAARRNPHLYERYVAEQRAGKAPVAKALPAPAPAPVRPHWTVTKLQEMAAQRVAKSRTPLTEHAALLEVLATPEGRALAAAHYQHNPHLLGTRG